MARRTTLDPRRAASGRAGAPAAVDDGIFDDGDFDDTGSGDAARSAGDPAGSLLTADRPFSLPAPRQRLSRPRPRNSASGGRWLVWTGRVLAWAVLALIGYRGVAAIIAGPAQSPPAPAAASRPARSFPVSLASAYALQFGEAYLNLSPATAAARARELAAFLPPGTDPQLGWNGTGTQRLQSEQVAAVSVRSDRQAVVTLLAQVNGRLIELAVPVYAAGGGLAVSGEPALLPAPARATVPRPGGLAADPVAQAALAGVLPSFFRAYASGSPVTLARFLAPGAHVTGLDGMVGFASLGQVTVPRGGATRRITAAVTWLLPARPGTAQASARTGSSGSGSAGSGSSRAGGTAASRATVEVTYQLTVVHRAGIWDVVSVGAATGLAGQP